MKKTPLFRIAGFKRLAIVLALLAGAAVFLFAVLLLTLSITEYGYVVYSGNRFKIDAFVLCR